MIKKINILLIVSAIIGSIYIVLSKSQSPVLVLKDLSIILTINALYIIQKISKIKLSDEINFIYILFIIALSLMVASLWEMFEYTSSCLFNVDPQRVKLTGVSDTMGDIIVAFLGSILVSICYYFEHKGNYNLLITRFIKHL